MNSFNTDEDTLKILRKYRNVRVSVHTFNQSRFPRINKETLHPIVRDLKSQDMEAYYPPGHGNFYESFYNSGLLERFINEGKEVCFISNVDNLGATVDLSKFVVFDFGFDFISFHFDYSNDKKKTIQSALNCLLCAKILSSPRGFNPHFPSSPLPLFSKNLRFLSQFLWCLFFQRIMIQIYPQIEQWAAITLRCC